MHDKIENTDLSVLARSVADAWQNSFATFSNGEVMKEVLHDPAIKNCERMIDDIEPLAKLTMQELTKIREGKKKELPNEYVDKFKMAACASFLASHEFRAEYKNRDNLYIYRQNGDGLLYYCQQERKEYLWQAAQSLVGAWLHLGHQHERALTYGNYDLNRRRHVEQYYCAKASALEGKITILADGICEARLMLLDGYHDAQDALKAKMAMALADTKMELIDKAMEQLKEQHDNMHAIIDDDPRGTTDHTLAALDETKGLLNNHAKRFAKQAAEHRKQLANYLARFDGNKYKGKPFKSWGNLNK